MATSKPIKPEKPAARCTGVLAAIDAQIEAYECELEATASLAKLMVGGELGARIAILHGTIDRLKVRRHELAANEKLTYSAPSGGTPKAK